MSNRPRKGEKMKQEPCETAANQPASHHLVNKQWLAVGAEIQKWPASTKFNYYHKKCIWPNTSQQPLRPKPYTNTHETAKFQQRKTVLNATMSIALDFAVCNILSAWHAIVWICLPWHCKWMLRNSFDRHCRTPHFVIFGSPRYHGP